MWRDLRTAVRALAHAPAFTISAVLALALAIGANGAIFGLVDALWFRPPDVRQPEEIVRVFGTTADRDDAGWSWPEYLDIASGVEALEETAVRGRRGAVLTAADGSQELLLVNVVSTNFFRMLGIQPSLGRLFGPGDEASLEAVPGVVLGHGFWRSYFAGDPGVVGRKLQLGRGQSSTVTVLGVLPATFRDLEAAADRDLWMPPQTWMVIGGERAEFERRDDRWFEVIARRRSGASVAAAQSQVAALAAGFARQDPAGSAGRGARVVSDRDRRLERGGVAARAMLGLVLLVVLITCVNVANLLLARAAARTQDLSVRFALGAGRWRIVRQLSAESAVLGILGALGGMLVAAWMLRLLPALMTTPPGMRSYLVFQIDERLMLFTAGVTLVTTVLFGLAPALAGARADLGSVIKASTGAGRHNGGFRRVLVAAQVAVSLVLLCVAAALARSYVETQRGDIGFTREPRLTLWTTFGSGDAITGGEAVRQLEALPGVTAVAVAIRAPLSLSGGGMALPLRVPGVPVDEKTGVPQVKFNAVSANYFAVLGTRIVLGRAFSAEEERGGEATVVVNEQFGRQYLAGRDPLGAVIDLGGAPHRVIGIAQDGVVNEVGEPPQAYVYLPYWRGRYGETTFMLATDGDPAPLAASARTALRRVSPQLDPRRSVTTVQYIEFATSMHRTTAALALILGIVGLVLTTIGVYGVVAYRTTRRTREIGIRMALGAIESQVLRLVLRDGLTLGVIGVVVGLPLALGATRLTSAMLVGVDPWHPLAFAGAAVVLLLSVAVATLIPAVRAMRVQPSTALRA